MNKSIAKENEIVEVEITRGFLFEGKVQKVGTKIKLPIKKARLYLANKYIKEFEGAKVIAYNDETTVEVKPTPKPKK